MESSKWIHEPAREGHIKQVEEIPFTTWAREEGRTKDKDDYKRKSEYFNDLKPERPWVNRSKCLGNKGMERRPQSGTLEFSPALDSGYGIQDQSLHLSVSQATLQSAKIQSVGTGRHWE